MFLASRIIKDFGDPSKKMLQLLLGHQILDSTVRYLGIEVDDAPDVTENIQI